ncbi:Starch-binding associating with outer membrane [Chitinophaga costaii]|uniref:Starch-binding associating with outer membrane n=1 Tax=Chitinophaga costaii TaxID=1335309 RepID=A0A1C4CII6_9BACT|nr:RagB/SusD family nutrient uptake outer membrane protein [Chitinophaga costaii]PUZ27076.1 RagB/SusD family nutrient uptake outer membrane protein [Chitinophaga costaii]SCC18950.1 Starch-binding associating with outer membrane [Chitinophaga costaii]
MKNIFRYKISILVLAAGAWTSCNKLLDKDPTTQGIRTTDSTTISATQAEASMQGLYQYYKNDVQEWSIFDKITNGDVIADNCYAGGDNSDNITLDQFSANSLNGNVNRDFADGYAFIGRANITIHDVSRSVDPALTEARRAQILSEAMFMRAFNYFDLVQLYGRIPLKLEPSDNSSAEALINSSLKPQVGSDTIYQAILNDLWYAKEHAQEIGATSSKYIVSKGAVWALLAKVYATMPTPNWDSVSYYCDQVIPHYSLVSDYTYLWDNKHKSNTEAIWEMVYDGYDSGDKIGDWIPSIFVGMDDVTKQFIGGGWKKFSTPTNDLVNLFVKDGDSIRLHASITFLNVSGQFTDNYWPVSRYPFITKYNDPNHGVNDYYPLRLPDILLLKAEALVQKGDINSAMDLVKQIRARVSLGAKTATSADQANQVIADERREELAFEGHRWFDLLRTGKAQQVMEAQKDGNGVSLGYNVPDYRLVLPIPQNQIDLNPRLTQNPNY